MLRVYACDGLVRCQVNDDFDDLDPHRIAVEIEVPLRSKSCVRERIEMQPYSEDPIARFVHGWIIKLKYSARLYACSRVQNGSNLSFHGL